MALKARDFALVFSALTDESDDFSYLVKKYKLDPARDFVGADLRNVDFGTLSTDVLNLKGANLKGADLSSIKCKKLITESAELKNTKLPPQHADKNIRDLASSSVVSDIKGQAILAIHSYVQKEDAKQWVADRIFSSGAPEYVEYVTPNEKAEIEERILRVAKRFSTAAARARRRRASQARKVGSQPGSKSKVVRFVSNIDLEKERFYEQLSGDALDHDFMSKFARCVHLDLESPNEFDLVFKRHSPEYNLVATSLEILKSSTENMSAKRAAFKNIVKMICWRCDRVTLLFVDFRPFSKILHHQIDRDIEAHMKFVFVGPYGAIQTTSMVRQDHFIHGYALEPRKFAETDLSRLLKRIGLATNGTLLFSSALTRQLRDLVGLEINTAIRRMAELVAVAISKVERQPFPKLNRRGQLYIH